MQPEIKKYFKYENVIDVLEQPAFAQQAVVLLDMLDCVIGFLGPDLDPLVADLIDLGARHDRYGVPKYMFVPMGEALVLVIKEYLGDELSDNEARSWKKILDFVFHYMCEGYQ
jgi:hemoglobin-like flavoprotein